MRKQLKCDGSGPRFFTPSGVAETRRRGGRETQEALARLHSGGSLNRSHAYAAEGGGSFAAPTGHALSKAGSVESELRNAIKDAYVADPTRKTVAPGLSVRITKRPLYEVEKAFQWALNHKLALKLDNKAFEKIAVSAGDVDFITYNEEITAVIAKVAQ